MDTFQRERYKRKQKTITVEKHRSFALPFFCQMVIRRENVLSVPVRKGRNMFHFSLKKKKKIQWSKSDAISLTQRSKAVSRSLRRFAKVPLQLLCYTLKKILFPKSVGWHRWLQQAVCQFLGIPSYPNLPPVSLTCGFGKFSVGLESFSEAAPSSLWRWH